MKTFIFVGLLILSLNNFTAMGQTQQVIVPYTLADRDRAIQTEAKLNALVDGLDSKFAGINVKFESIDKQFANIDKQFMYQQKQIDDIKTLFYWGFGILISLFIFMLGYMIWDRRTAMQPALLHASMADENSRDLKSILREYSKKHPDLAEILKTHGIL